MDEAADLIRALASLLWPVVGIVVVLRLLPELRKRIRSGDINVKFGQLELSLQDASDNLRKQVKDLQDAMAKLGGSGNGERPKPGGTTRSATLRSGGVPAATGGVAGPPTVLWVDTDPARSAYEVARVEEGGAQVHLARTKDEAFALVGQRGFDAVVAEPDGALLRELRGRAGDVPVVVYGNEDMVRASSGRLTEAGATVVTSSPLELFRELKDLGLTR